MVKALEEVRSERRLGRQMSTIGNLRFMKNVTL